MTIVDMICRMNEVVSEIRKCEELYHYSEDANEIYLHLTKSICTLRKSDVLFAFAKKNISSSSDIKELKEELLWLYKAWKREFVCLIESYHNVIEEVL